MKIKTGTQTVWVDNQRTTQAKYIEPNGKLLLASLVVAFLLLCALFPGCKAYNRYQKRADANNRVTVTNTLTKAVTAQANQRYQAAIGIKRAQDEIQKTLTPMYIQFEAIEAQKAIAASGRNNTVIYVPSGTNGTPVITQDSGAKTGTTQEGGG